MANKKSLTKQNILIALSAIKSQMLRAILSMLIIAIGITALVGILTSIDAIKSSITDEFTSMGANTFTILKKRRSDGDDDKKFESISYREVLDFKKLYNFPSTVSISDQVSFNSTVKYKSKKSNPNISIQAVDQFYLSTSGYRIEFGRNITENDVRANSRVVLLGKELAKTLFVNESAVDKIISIAGGKYKVIGILKEKGNASGFGGDRNCLMPISVARQQFPLPDASYGISIIAKRPEDLNPAISEATGLLRALRGDELDEEDSFRVRRSDNLASILIENLQYVTVAATVIGLITLLGAAIGLMNIMLVSVTERTKEIGTRKAVGAKMSTIRSQFLIEAIVICQFGGLVGIVLGIIIGNVIAALIGTNFIIPWVWIFLGVTLCLITGVLAGFYPAQKAARLDPVEALRYD
jgi:putative ABC transport system permease protein|tara:strand:- start:27573 stop:28805 length:1233 start_codon:yes stop_codon:yes gene_type:complete